MEVVADLLLVLSGGRLIPTCVGNLPYLSSSGVWTDDDQWLVLYAYGLPCNISGMRFCPAAVTAPINRAISNHVRYTTQCLHAVLTRQHWSEHYRSVIDAATDPNASKLGLLTVR